MVADGSLPDGADTVVFRPRTVRFAAYGIGALVLGASLVAMVIAGHTLVDRVGFTAFGLAIFWFCHREASVRAVAGEGELMIRNLFNTSTFEWSEVIGVVFPPGDPWAKIDLADGDTVSVMAIQRTDGTRGMREARRLATLIEQRGEAPEGD